MSFSHDEWWGVGARILFQAKGQRAGSPSLSGQHTSISAVRVFIPTEGQAQRPEAAWEDGDVWREAGVEEKMLGLNRRGEGRPLSNSQ